MLILCGCSGTESDEAQTFSKAQTMAAAPFESSIFGKSIEYDGFTPAENIEFPVKMSEITDMIEIKKTLCLLTDGAVYAVELETGESKKLFDTDAKMFASYGDMIYTYSPESGRLCGYGLNGEAISEQVISVESDSLTAQELFVTDGYYSFKCRDKSTGISVTQNVVFDRETLENVGVVSESKSISSVSRIFCPYKGNSLIKVEESLTRSTAVDIYEVNLETGKSKKLNTVEISATTSEIDIAYREKTDTLLIFAAPSSEQEADGSYVPFIMECSLSDPDNILLKRFGSDSGNSGRVFVGVWENIVSAVVFSDGRYRYFDYLNPPDSIVFACNMAQNYSKLINGFEKETGITVRTVDYGEDFSRLDIKLMAGDTDFDLFAPVYYQEHKYFASGMFEDLSQYEGLKKRLDGDTAAGYVSNLDGKYIGIPTGIGGYFADGYQPDPVEISRLIYLADNVDIVKGIYRDSDGGELYKLLKFIYDGSEGKLPFGDELNILSNNFVIMNPNSLHKENAVRFLEYVFDACNGDLEGFEPTYADIDSTEGVKIHWQIFAWDYVGPIFEASNNIRKCDGKDSTIKKIARETAAEVKMRLEE